MNLCMNQFPFRKCESTPSKRTNSRESMWHSLFQDTSACAARFPIIPPISWRKRSNSTHWWWTSIEFRLILHVKWFTNMIHLRYEGNKANAPNPGNKTVVLHIASQTGTLSQPSPSPMKLPSSLRCLSPPTGTATITAILRISSHTRPAILLEPKPDLRILQSKTARFPTLRHTLAIIGHRIPVVFVSLQNISE